MRTTRFILIAITLLGVTNSTWAQDTIKVGINEQLIQVTAPEENQKITIMIEDSAANYKVDITRYTGLPEKKVQLAPLTKRQLRKKEKNWTSRFFSEAEFGYSGMLAKQTAFGNFLSFEEDSTGIEFLDTIFRGPVGDYSTESFSSDGSYWGMYLDLTIREKTRKLWNTDNIYMSKATHFRFNQNFAGGRRYYRDVFGFEDFRVDSLVSERSYQSRLSITSLQLSMRHTIGYLFNEEKNISMEYGVDLGMQFALAKRFSTSESTQTSVTFGDPQARWYDTDATTPFFTFNHRLGFNYGRISANMGVSFGSIRVGSFTDNFIQGNRMTLGLAYRW
jgi:hypothetical protein